MRYLLDPGVMVCLVHTYSSSVLLLDQICVYPAQAVIIAGSTTYLKLNDETWTQTQNMLQTPNRVFAKKNIQPIIPSNLKKAKFIRASLCVCDERIAEIAFEASISLASFLKFITSPKKTNNLVSKKGKIDWHREAQHIFLGTRRRGTRM